MKSHSSMGDLLKFSGLILLAGMATALPARAATFDCVMDPAQKVKIGSSVTGVLRSVLVARGSSVEAASAALSKLQASSVEGIEAQRARLKLIQIKLGRSEPLAAKGITSQ